MLVRLIDFFSRWFSRSSPYPVRQKETEPWPPDHPLVSVIIPCYNHGGYLAEAVDSVLAQTWMDLEIIVVNDGSNDPDTLEALSHFERPKTRMIHHQRNQGLPAARNTGIREARGKYICCLDADDKLHPTYLEKALLAMEANAGIDFVWSWTQVFGDEDRVWYAPQFDPGELIHYNQLNPPGVFRRCTWEEVGGYRESMRQGYEDWEFWIRLVYHGYRGYRIPEKLIYVRREGESFYHRAIERHQELVSDIKRCNPEIYEDQAWIEEVKASYREVYTDQPFLNLRDVESYRALDQPALWVYRNTGEEGSDRLRVSLREMESHPGEALILSTSVLKEGLVDRIYQVTPYQYILPYYLPRYTWKLFANTVLPATRRLRKSAILEV